jgi:AcrR family transcriptional regulator
MKERRQTRMRGEDRRALILAQAKILFAQKGYREASTGELARASGITEPILYKHFGSKKNLYLAVLTIICDQLYDRYYEKIEKRASLGLLDCLSNLLLDYRTAGMEDHDGIHMLLNAALESNDPDIAKLSRDHDQKVYSLIHRLLEEAQKQALISQKLDLSAATWGYMSFLFALEYRAKSELFEKFNKEVIVEINRLWLESLRNG